MKESEVLTLLEETGAIMRGHFELSSGRHSEFYVEKFRVLERPDAAMRLGAAIAERLAGRDVDVVLSPAVGAIVLGFASAAAMEPLRPRFIFCERQKGEMRLRRGFHIDTGERVVVVEDVITTGASLRETLGLVAPGELAGIACLLDRSRGGDFGGDVQALARFDAPSWAASECRLCEEGTAVVSPGSRLL